MKRIKIFTMAACIMLISNLSFGQFLGSGTTAYTGSVYHPGGNLGIGTDTPLKDLHIKKTTANSTLRLETVIGSKFGTYYGWDVENTGAYLKFNYGSGPNGSFSTSERISFHSNGIINATSIYLKENPYALKVLLNDGKYLRLNSLSDYQFQINNGTSTIDAITIDENNGYVGIGNDDPSFNLDVTGMLRVRGADLRLGTHDGRDQGVNLNNRALVHGDNDMLIVNYGGDFEGGVSILGNVGIGTTDPGDARLAVNGKMWATEIKVAATNPWPDFVFENGYSLKSLPEVESYINANKHLPNVPSAEEIEDEGINLGEMDAILLQKIEELTLYTIEQQKLIEDMKKEINELKK